MIMSNEFTDTQISKCYTVGMKLHEYFFSLASAISKLHFNGLLFLG